MLSTENPVPLGVPDGVYTLREIWTQVSTFCILQISKIYSRHYQFKEIYIDKSRKGAVASIRYEFQTGHVENITLYLMNVFYAFLIDICFF